jgi:hypothetical protein
MPNEFNVSSFRETTTDAPPASTRRPFGWHRDTGNTQHTSQENREVQQPSQRETHKSSHLDIKAKDILPSDLVNVGERLRKDLKAALDRMNGPGLKTEARTKANKVVGKIVDALKIHDTFKVHIGTLDLESLQQELDKISANTKEQNDQKQPSAESHDRFLRALELATKRPSHERFSRDLWVGTLTTSPDERKLTIYDTGEVKINEYRGKAEIRVYSNDEPNTSTGDYFEQTDDPIKRIDITKIEDIEQVTVSDISQSLGGKVGESLTILRKDLENLVATRKISRYADNTKIKNSQEFVNKWLDLAKNGDERVKERLQTAIYYLHTRQSHKESPKRRIDPERIKDIDITKIEDIEQITKTDIGSTLSRQPRDLQDIFKPLTSQIKLRTGAYSETKNSEAFVKAWLDLTSSDDNRVKERMQMMIANSHIRKSNQTQQESSTSLQITKSHQSS